MKIVTIALALLVLAGCRGSGSLFPNSPSPSASSSPFPTMSVAPSPTPAAVPDTPPPTGAPASKTCVDGWTRPVAGSALASRPLRLIRRIVPIPGDPVIVDLRYFTGPESPPSEMGYLTTVKRWYVKLFSKDDLAFQGRFLVEAREFGSGVVAVAPYDTHGFRSPDWSGFQYDEADADKKAYPGLPGTWSGIRYDFVRGGAGLDVPGLPDTVVGCIAGS
jgi:hypothetical protein